MLKFFIIVSKFCKNLYIRIIYNNFMVLNEKESDNIIEFVKKQPRTIQEISKYIQKSWLTTDSYIKQIKDSKGIIDVRTFRAGTRGALKIVFYNFSESVNSDDVKNIIYQKIISSKRKEDFDFLDIFQNIDDRNKSLSVSDINDKNEFEIIKDIFEKATEKIYFFSGNLSFTNLTNKKEKMIDIIENLLKRKISIKIICRINLATLSNITKFSELLKKYPKYLEIRHAYQPLRGFIIDGKFSRFINNEEIEKYKMNELPKSFKLIYSIDDKDWNSWLEKVFWNIFRSSSEYQTRVKEFKKIKIR